MPPKPAKKDDKKKGDEAPQEDGTEREMVEKELVIGYLKSKLGRLVHLMGAHCRWPYRNRAYVLISLVLIALSPHSYIIADARRHRYQDFGESLS